MRVRMSVARCCCDPCSPTINGYTADLVDYTDDFSSASMDANWNEVTPGVLGGGVYTFSKGDDIRRYNRTELSGVSDFEISVDVELGTIPVGVDTTIFYIRLFNALNNSLGTHNIGIRKDAGASTFSWSVKDNNPFNPEYATQAYTGKLNLKIACSHDTGNTFDVDYYFGTTKVHSDSHNFGGTCHHELQMDHDGAVTNTVDVKIDNYSFNVL